MKDDSPFTEQDALAAAERDARTLYDVACIREESPNAVREDVDFKKLALRNLQFIQDLAAPAEGAQGECKHEWRSGDNSIVQRAVFCIHCQEIRKAKAAGSNEPLIDSSGGAKCVTDEQGRPMTYWGGKVPQPAEGDGAVASAYEGVCPDCNNLDCDCDDTRTVITP